MKLKKVSKSFYKFRDLPTWVKNTLLIIFVLYALVFHPQFYFGIGFKGKVVDVEGRPIEGAVVVMTFILWERKFIHGRQMVAMAGEETVTDSDGTFRLPFWISNRRPQGVTVGSATPKIRIYKNGYHASNSIRSIEQNSLSDVTMFIPFQPKDTVFVLRKYQNPEEQKKDWRRIRRGLHWGYPPLFSRCEWKKFTRFIAERTTIFESLKQIVPESEYRDLDYPLERIAIKKRAGCGLGVTRRMNKPKPKPTVIVGQEPIYE